MFGDIYNIADRIKAIDKDFRVVWNKTKAKYFIYHKKSLFMEADKLDHNLYNHIKKVVYMNVNSNIENEIETSNTKLELSKERQINNFAEDAAREIYKPLRRILNY